MGISLILAKILGAFFTIIGVSVILRRNELEKIVEEFTKSRMLSFIMGEFILIAGLFILALHNVWEYNWRTIITVIGWLTAIKGATYLMLPQKDFKKVIEVFNKKNLYSLWGVLIIALGIYLLIKGFQA